MRLQDVRLQHVRCLADIGVDLAPGINMFVGANGAGKTSVLESVFLLSHGRSFRSGAKDALLARGAATLSVFAQLHHADARVVRLGIGRTRGRWEARVDSEAATLGQLVRECAVVCFEPGSHALIAGGAEERRRFLDWGVFHVEHTFLRTWQRYQRALKQRNSLLRAVNPPGTALFEPWESELSQTATLIDEQRVAYLQSLRGQLRAKTYELLPELGEVSLSYRRGWSEQIDLAESLAENRSRDVLRGHTTSGPHRADWALSFERAPLREHLSRGQEKLAALSCLLAQAGLYAQDSGQWPVICLDDLTSELDLDHQTTLVHLLSSVDAQVLITGTHLPVALNSVPHTLFHVKLGQIDRLL